MKALVIGGTGPTGPAIVDGLLVRGYEVTIYHRGTHEVEFGGPVAHLHGDPFSRDNLERDLGSRTFDLIVANYGRLRYVAKTVAGRTGRLIGITGGASYVGFSSAEDAPLGTPMPFVEDSPTYETRNERNHFGFMVAQGERDVLEGHRRGDYQAAVLRYPRVYGPRQLAPCMWPIVRRVLDGRRRIIVPGDGLRTRARGYAENMAHAVLLVADRFEHCAGQIYNVADEQTFTIKQLVNLIARILDHEWEVVEALHPMAEALSRPYSTPPHHMMFDLAKIKRDAGYRDLVPAEEGVRRTVQWLVANREQMAGRIEAALGDRFDYQLEDQFIALYKRAIADVTAALPEPPPLPGYEYQYRTS